MQYDAVEDPVEEMASRPIWSVIERAGKLAHAGRYMEAEATRYAARYHGLVDSQGRPSL